MGKNCVLIKWINLCRVYLNNQILNLFGIGKSNIMCKIEDLKCLMILWENTFKLDYNSSYPESQCLPVIYVCLKDKYYGNHSTF